MSTSDGASLVTLEFDQPSDDVGKGLSSGSRPISAGWGFSATGSVAVGPYAITRAYAGFAPERSVYSIPGNRMCGDEPAYVAPLKVEPGRPTD